MDKIVEIARFQYPAEALTLRSLLEAEGIPCFLKDELSNQLLGNLVDIGGIRVEIREKDVPRALEVMRAGGYPIETEEEPESWKTISRLADRIPILKKLPLDKQLLIVLAITVLLLGLFLLLSYLLSTSHT